ncbi:four-carbon acid sugar kinase family protein [Bosea psychrotolerans]|uniref:Uncharacterized protein YgbK (DUF1537 family) n=1 Tax=Bosea psychrotolerans TaxID=1871628 RepID=A0A2S4MLH5_9HYPH|nr:four-carbon acid sugar kinase family protein [Bosea psychrotolerans]POR55592.1 uncharacterized protein YgbK (DUF1537 family) [Bosea psychrotolerans]
MAPLRLLADDLTGALDSAAAFGSPAEPVAVRWHGEVPATGAIAMDSRSREVSAEQARSAVAAIAPALWARGLGLAYKKIDSLLRGQEVAEIATILDLLRPAYCIIAPAFPAQRRITRGGRQYAWADGDWRAAPTDLTAGLAVAGHPVTQAVPGDALPAGISLWDVETDADLDAVIATASGLDDVLWVGSAGLAAALARAAGIVRRIDDRPLAGKVLGLVGSDHAAIGQQLDRLGPLHIVLGPASNAEIARRLTHDGIVFASVALPDGTSRRDAAALIDARLAALLQHLDRPDTLFAAGGETLRSICESLGTERLDVTGEIMPGVPRSIMRGGRWDGVAVISKSGAFGAPDLLQQLAATRVAAFAGAAA